MLLGIRIAFLNTKANAKKEVTHLEREVGDAGSDHFRI